MKTFSAIREKTLTPAEKKKREEVAKAIERENPSMPMAKKMAIATATAKKVAEATEDLSSAGNRRLASIANNPNHPDRAAAKNELARRRMQKEEAIESAAEYLINENIDVDDLSEEQINELLGSIVKGAAKLAYKGVKKAVVNNKGNFRFSTAGKADAADAKAKKLEKANKDRERLKKAQERIRKAQELAAQARRQSNESVEQIDELSKRTLGKYVKLAVHDRESRQKNAEKLSNVGREIKSNDPEHANKLFTKAGAELDKAANRKRGINKAIDKLTNEAAFDDESKAHDRHYEKQTPAVQNALDRYTRQGMSYKQAHAKISNPSNGHVLRKEITPLHEENLAEISQATKDRYVQKSISAHGHYSAVAKDAKGRGDETTYQKARRIMKKRNQGMARAFGQTKDNW